MKQVRGESGGSNSSLFCRLPALLRNFGRFAARQRRSLGKRIAELREVFARIAVRSPWYWRLRRQWRIIRQSRLMDAGWYFAKYPAARCGKPDPVLHYLSVGALKGWDPNPLFSGRWYLEQNPNVAKTGENPFVHYLRVGATEGCEPHLMFRGRWYLDQNPDVARAGENPLIHYLTVGASEGREPHPLFDSEWYLSQNPDVAAAGLNPFAHYADCGKSEGRDPRPHFEGSRDLSQNYCAENLLNGTRCDERPRLNRDSIPEFAVYFNTSGNYFFQEIAFLLHAALRDAGFSSVLRTDEDGGPANADFHLIVAPHEFFPLGKGVTCFDKSMKDRLFFLNTEQPQTSWFNLARSMFPYVRHIFDMDRQTANFIESSGFSASHLPLGYVAQFAPYTSDADMPLGPETESLCSEVRRWRDVGGPLAERPIDLSFVGEATHRRSAFFARAAPLFAKHECHLRLMPAGSGPWTAGGIQTHPRTRTTVALSQRSKIFLNIHRDQEHYFEWHRIVLMGMWQRALVLSETVTEAPPFVAGRDYVQATLEEMPHLIDYYLRDAQGIEEAERIRNSGHERLKASCELPRLMKELWTPFLSEPS